MAWRIGAIISCDVTRRDGQSNVRPCRDSVGALCGRASRVSQSHPSTYTHASSFNGSRKNSYTYVLLFFSPPSPFFIVDQIELTSPPRRYTPSTDRQTWPRSARVCGANRLQIWSEYYAYIYMRVYMYIIYSIGAPNMCASSRVECNASKCTSVYTQYVLTIF